MDDFQGRLRLATATIDELLSDAFIAAPRQAGDADAAARRLAAWRQAAAAGDPALFARRLERDGLTESRVLEQLAAARPAAAGDAPAWLADAAWIGAALRAPAAPIAAIARAGGVAFGDLLAPVVAEAAQRLWDACRATAGEHFTEAARAGMAAALLERLSELCAPGLYERFAKAREAGGSYAQFIATMRNDGLTGLFDEKPVLLRLIAVVTRQWIDTGAEFAARLAADLPALRREFFAPGAAPRVAGVDGDVADPHNDGRAVQIVRFADGVRLIYKPKDLQLDVAWQRLVGRLNRDGAPIVLKAARAIACDGYGWTEFIDHTGCADAAGCARFYRRAGAWLALLHLFAATDMHQENLIAAGEHPVPVDLETILQPSAEEHKSGDAEGEAFDAALDIVGNSVMTVGLLPAYGRSPDNNVFAMGGMAADWGARTVITWSDLNSDAMRPTRTKLPAETNSNLPHVGGRYAKFADHVDDFVAGFADYADFLRRYRGDSDALFGGFAGVPVRRVIRPTRFYYMLLRRLKDHRSMTDGALWSAQADFVTRLAEWDKDTDPLWRLYRAERDALVTLNVPHFTSPSDGAAIADARGASAATAAIPGLRRARERLQKLTRDEIAWQIEVIRENTASLLPPPAPTSAEELTPVVVPNKGVFATEVDRIAAEIARQAVRRGRGAAWIGLDWLGDSDVFQLVCLGTDLYNGSTGIALFLAAHAAVSGNAASRELSLAGVARLRKNLAGRNAARMARLLGVGGATGLGSIVYGLAAMAKTLGDANLLADADAAARLMTDDVIAADRQLDVIGGSAGAILGLLRLQRDADSALALERAVKCGEHLLRQSRVDEDGRRSFPGQGEDARPLNGMSHGAAGFAYALAALAAAASRDDFAAAAAECIAFEDASYDAERHNWPDLRTGAPAWPCQWCHGAPGIGLARLGIERRGGQYARAAAATLSVDIGNAAEGVAHGPAGSIDTLCCGTLGRIEFMCEAAGPLGRADLAELAAQRLAAVVQRAATTGDYRWNSGKGRFNLGLFRGLAGMGYTLLRRLDPSLPNVLIWE